VSAFCGVARSKPVLWLRLTAALVAVVALSGVAVSAGPGEANASTGRPVVLVVGDSLTVGAERRGQLSVQLRAGGVTPVVHGQNGMSTYQAPPVITAARAKSKPRLIVVALGTNDAMVNAGGDAFGRRIAEVMAAAGKTPVLWVDVHATAFRDQARAANRQLRMAAKKWPNLTVLEWSSTRGSSMLIYDGVHLTARGYQVRAAFITAAVSKALGA
jgi:lysophospholipase L1-like esterase